ncbi:MAG: hypothetical protein KBA60_07115 [Flavobacteriales bacterium]|jgi:hypothetical protein|nr:hypothetical protein [Flavobacteriales bacterium]MBP7155762.1 hypothetical protein [Flavobacteriales bacterium]HQV75360.1 hypothetical protein [Flavobacteriales bacterium]
MKAQSVLLTGLMILATVKSQARIIRVNSVAAFATTCNDCFQTFSSAYEAAAQDGDTIHLEPSDANYEGNLTIEKRLVIIGAGYKLGAAPNNGGLQANTQTSKVDYLSINALGSGTVLMGLHFMTSGGGNHGLDIEGAASNITVRRCFFDGQGIGFPSGGNVSDVLIGENYIEGGIGVASNSNVQTVVNLTIRNNIIGGALYFNRAEDVIENLLVLNNTLLDDGNHGLKNAEVAYNVFYQGNIAGTSNTIHDNISTTALTGGDASNQVVNMGNVYNLNIGTDDSKYDILSSSPYNEGGSEERGAFSGISPYRLSGIPNIPTIYTLQSTLNTSPGGSVEVTLSTRTNN